MKTSHRRYLAALPATLTRAAAADLAGSARATALMRRLSEAAVPVRVAAYLALMRLGGCAVSVGAAVMALALVIAVQLTREEV